ncbi:hypothetical protein EVAR_103328_1 [Eumeta japonica]|uniref:Smoothelin domain-containing protein n=1 Tax=Eumeta variegata TaxID=151549 RepID=A0A4C1Z9W9_EUMVA|nr:hypothetical protein EVAR_103328_1 [Eumeta japonica]
MGCILLYILDPQKRSRMNEYILDLVFGLIHNSFNNHFRIQFANDVEEAYKAWQQTEDFSKKKEIRAHMYRLREERLRDLYSAETALGKGYEFASSRTHSDSFADQSFQSMKSKEVRDAGSPPKEYAYHTQANVSLSGPFTKPSTFTGSKDPELVTHTEYNSSTSATDQRASSLAHHRTESHNKSMVINTSNSQDIHDTSSSDIVSDTTCFDNTNNKILTREEGRGELISRKIEYPDENTRIVTETRCLPDGTTVTSTEREFRVQASTNSRSEQQSRQVHTDANVSTVSTLSKQLCSAETKTAHEDVDFTHYDTTDAQTLRKNIELNQTRNSNIKIEKRSNEDYNQPIQSDLIDIQDSFNTFNQKQHRTDNIETLNQAQDYRKEETVRTQLKKDESIQHVSSTINDYVQRKISSDLSPTHQAWASTLRGDTPPTSRTSTRASSPGSRTYQSSTSSLRSSISPEKNYRKPSSRSGSPTKIDRTSPIRKTPQTRTNVYKKDVRKTNETTDAIISEKTYQRSWAKSPSPQRKPQVGKAPRISPEKSSTKQLSSPRTSPIRKELPYQSNLQDDVIMMATNDRFTRTSVSPERNKNFRSTITPTKTYVDSDYQNTTPKYSIPNRKSPDRMSESSLEYIASKNFQSQEVYDKVRNGKKESYRLIDEETKVLARFDEMLSRTSVTPDKDIPNENLTSMSELISVNVADSHPNKPSTPAQSSSVPHRDSYKSPSPMRTKTESIPEKPLKNKSPSPTRTQTKEVLETRPPSKSPSPSRTKLILENPPIKEDLSKIYERPGNLPKKHSLDKSPSPTRTQTRRVSETRPPSKSPSPSRTKPIPESPPMKGDSSMVYVRPENLPKMRSLDKSPSPTRTQTKEVSETRPPSKSPSPSRTKRIAESPPINRDSKVYEKPGNFPKISSLETSPSPTLINRRSSPEKGQLDSDISQINLETTLKEKEIEQYPSHEHPKSRSSPKKDILDKNTTSVRPTLETKSEKKILQKNTSPTRTKLSDFPVKDDSNNSPTPIYSKLENTEKNPSPIHMKPTNDSEKQPSDITSPSRTKQTMDAEIKITDKTTSSSLSIIESTSEERPARSYLSPTRMSPEKINIRQEKILENSFPKGKRLRETPEKLILDKSPSPTRTKQKSTPESRPLDRSPSPVQTRVTSTPEEHSPYKSSIPSRPKSSGVSKKQPSNKSLSPIRANPSSTLDKNSLHKSSSARNKQSYSPERGRLHESPTDIKSAKEKTSALFRSPSPPSKSKGTFTDDQYIDETDIKADSITSEEDFISLSKKNQKRSTSPHKPQITPSSTRFTSEDKQRHTLDFISHEITKENVDKKIVNTQRMRQLVTPSTSPTRKAKAVDKTPTEESSPTTSVSEILYFGSSQPTATKPLVTDVDDRNEHLETNEKSKTITNNEKYSNDWEIKRSPSPSKIPRRSSSPDQIKQQSIDFPRKSSLKKPSSDNIQKPVDHPSTTFNISLSNDQKTLPEHKIVKKDQPDVLDNVTKIKEKPPLERRETYEERCRKILGMMDENISTTKIDEKNISVESSSSRKKANSNISTAPVAGSVSPTSHYSTGSNIKTKHVSAESNYHNEEVTEELRNRTFKISSRESSRDSSPTKLQDIICVKSTLKNTEQDSQINTVKKVSVNNVMKSSTPQECQTNVIPHKDTPKTNVSLDQPSRSRSNSPLKSVDRLKDVTKTKTEEFISSERETEILDRVKQSLRKLSPNRKSTSREQSPNKTLDSLIISQNEVKNDNIVNKETMSDSIESINSAHMNSKPEKKINLKRDMSPTKKCNVSKPNTNAIHIHTTNDLSKKVKTVSNNEIRSDIKSTIKSKDSLKKSSEGSSISSDTPQKLPTESKKITPTSKQNYSSKSLITKVSTTTNKLTKSLIATKTKNNNNETKDIVDWKAKNEKQQIFNKDNVERKVDTKFSRTNSDTSVRNKKPSPQRNSSKPDIQIVDATTISAKTTKSLMKKDSLTKNNKSKIVTTKDTKTKSIPKPKSATALNISRDEHDVIVKIEQAKSSRENSPDNVCPTPINFEEKELGKPRLPDEVSEPDDDICQRTHNIIHETESIVDDIVEIVEDEELFTKKTESDHIATSDECLLTVTEKVTKFNNKRDASPIKLVDSSNNFIQSEKIDRSYVVDENLKSDDCLLTVSEKVSKFTSGRNMDKDVKNATRNIILKESSIDNENFEDDFTRMSVNDKAHLFIETSENSTKPSPSGRSNINNVHEKVCDKIIKNTKQSHETDSRDIKRKATHDYDVTQTKEHDGSSLTYSKETISSHAKVRDSVSNHFQPSDKVETAKNTVRYSTEILTTHDDCIVETKEHDDMSLSYTKETVSSHAKVKENISPNLKPVDKPETVRVMALRSSEAVKKAKALFENIASTATEKSHEKNHAKVTKLTDISSIKKSMNTEDKFRKDRKTSSIPESDVNKLEGGLHDQQQTSQNELPITTYSNDAIDTQETMSIHTKEYTNKRNVLPEPHTSPETQPQKPSKIKIDFYNHESNVSHQKHTSEVQESKKEETITQCTRRGSGKFGVELRRTSTDRRLPNNERRTSGSDQRQPCIEEIFDLSLLEQLLEKVVGYEQRRRIRAQIRIVKGKLENEHVDGYPTSPKGNVKIQTVSVSKKHPSPDRLKSPKTSEKPTANGHIYEPADRDTVSKISSIKSPKPVWSETHGTARSPTRQPSPEKRTRVSSPTKTPAPPTNKSNRIDEYASAPINKIGLKESGETTATKTKKEVTKREERKDIKTKQYSKYEIAEHFVEDTGEAIGMNGQRSPSRERQTELEEVPQEKTLRLHQRTPSPDFKRPKADTAKHKPDTAIRTVYDIEKKIKTKQVQDEKPTWVTNRNLKKVTSETRTFSTKKMETDKLKYRVASPGKDGGAPIDAITSSYGPGPLDKDGKPLFGIKALRNGASNYQVKGTVVHEEYHARDGEEPTSAVTVTRYGSGPTPRGSRLHGLAALTSPKAVVETSSRSITTSERRESVERAMRADERTAPSAGAGGGPDSERLRAGAGGSGAPETETRAASKARPAEKMVRQSSVKTLTEKFIKNTTDTLKSERSAYPKAGLILRSSGLKDGTAGHSQQNVVLRRTGSQRSMDSGEEHTECRTTTTVTVEARGGRGAQKHAAATTTTTKVQSFLDSDAKVTGVQDILSRMKNADIVLTASDNSEDAEARALLNKFLGASVLMAGMQGYVTERPGGAVVVQVRPQPLRPSSPSMSYVLSSHST